MGGGGRFIPTLDKTMLAVENYVRVKQHMYASYNHVVVSTKRGGIDEGVVKFQEVLVSIDQKPERVHNPLINSEQALS